MAFCPDCNMELPDDVTECFRCGRDLTEFKEVDWVVVGTIDTKLYADFAREALASYDIPAVVRCKDGFFGDIGLPLRPFYDSRSAPFEVLVPADYREETVEILNMVVGDRWHERES